MPRSRHPQRISLHSGAVPTVRVRSNAVRSEDKVYQGSARHSLHRGRRFVMTRYFIKFPQQALS